MRQTATRGDLGRPASVLALFFTLLVAAAAAACSNDSPAEPYTGLSPTKEAAAQAVVDALAAGDMARLDGLAITAVEFRKNIWPHLPASHPDVGMPLDYVWADTHTKSRGTLAGITGKYRGRRAKVETLRFEGAPVDYGLFRVHRGTHLTLRNDAGELDEVQLFGSMVESKAGWKIYSYIAD
jgi:hypothetical protein